MGYELTFRGRKFLRVFAYVVTLSSVMLWGQPVKLLGSVVVNACRVYLPVAAMLVAQELAGG
jgi:hypothetical protein